LIRTINAGLNWLILLTPRWLPVFVLIPVLYLIGWVKAQLLTLVGLPTSAVSLVGTVFSFLLFLLLMPRWIRLRWLIKRPWVALGLRGVAPHQPSSFAVLFRGLLWSFCLLALIVLPLLLGHWAQFQRTDSVRLLLDAFVLLFGVGLAEELLFRGWLWEELNQLLGAKAGVISQAAIFSLVHSPFQHGCLANVGAPQRAIPLGPGPGPASPARPWLALGMCWLAWRLDQRLVSPGEKRSSTVCRRPCMADRTGRKQSQSDGWTCRNWRPDIVALASANGFQQIPIHQN
jgi:membrane protease YdiL (CAAX protease family)